MSILPLRTLTKDYPELKELHDEWVILLPNLRVQEIHEPAPSSTPFIFSAKIINDGTVHSTACDVIAQVIESTPPVPGTLSKIYRHGPRALRLAPLAPGMSVILDFGQYVSSSIPRIENPVYFLCINVDPATNTRPFGEVLESNEGDNSACIMFEPRPGP